ncbi:Structural maintenance of chromosomes protein 5 [Orbilia brochopaga]|uniref:Structural maintenance of chromosomes protein 5 n=1 Tax=Orbilia brochopaga TaxID=3140254 RepID=A0AAV9V003_9PEZI
MPPSLVPSRRPRSRELESEDPDPEISSASTPQTASKASSRRSQLGGSKLTIMSKRSSTSKSGATSPQEPTRSISGSKRRKLTPNIDDNGENSDSCNDEEEGDPEPQAQQTADKARGDRDDGESSVGEDDAADEDGSNDGDTEVVIPVAEDYDSEESETGMADSLDKMKKTVEEIPHAPGAIVRVQLENFVTYTRVTFEPGPSLNMVIGPNGTGKSTLVCAICLGLGFGPEHLGRAKDVAEFVKNGADSATIEIELKGFPTDEINPTVTRKIGRDGSSQYWIDGKKQSHKSVSQLTRLMNIQIDNLCQFLPQDRVVEFAGLGPVPLLRETQRAAAPPEVLKDHETLKKLRSQEVSLEVELDGYRQSLNTMVGRQNLLEREVARLIERQTLQEEIQLLEDAVSFVHYNNSRTNRDIFKQEYQECRDQLKEIRKEQEPQRKQIEEAQALQEELRLWVQKERASLASAEKDLKNEMEDGIGTLKKKEDKSASSLRALRATEMQRKKDLSDARAQIVRLEKFLEGDPGPIDLSQYNNRIEDISKQLRSLRADINQLDNEIEPLRTQGDQKKAQSRDITQWISRMDNIAGRRVEYLKRIFPEPYKVYDWLQHNKNKFKGPVYGPPIVECNIKNPDYQGEIEALFSMSDKLVFTCTNKDDFEELMTVVYGNNRDREGMGLSEVTIKYIEKGLDQFPRPASKDEIKSWGFDGLALDFIDGPSEVLSLLCQTAGLHRIGVAKRKLSIPQQQALKGKNMLKWISGNVMTQIRRRAEYGAETEMNSLVRPAKHFKTAPIDVQRLEESKGLKLQLEHEIKEIEDAIREIKEKKQSLDSKMSDLKTEKDQVLEEKEAKQKHANSFHKARIRLQSEKEQVSALEADGSGFKQKSAKIEMEKLQINMNRVKATAIYAEHVREFVSRYEALATAELHLIEASSNVQHHNNWNESFKERLDSKQRQCDDAKAKYEETVQKSKKLRDKCRDLIQAMTAEQQEAIKVHSTKTIEELKAEIQQENVRLESIHEGNPDAIRQYEARKKQIEELNGKVEEKEQALNKLQDNIKEVRARWEPRVDQLVNNISEAFSRSFEFIHCAGAVRIRKEGKDGRDFENWAIEIMVKFREIESMQVLTAQRQSGGERAVSTVFYLMALQSLARAPFRVVDEINQGMDPRNERLVHKRMVKIACKKHTSQYFLITPKLLVDLDYHERMKVLCINSGDWVIENHVQDFKKYIAAGRKLMAAA